MRKTALVLVLAAMFCVTSIVIFYIWQSHNRFALQTTSETSSTGAIKREKIVGYQVDRVTGEAWRIDGTTRVKVDEASRALPPERKPTYMPADYQSQLVGDGGFDDRGYFSGSIYNGSNWIVTKVTLRIAVKEANGKTRWDRLFDLNTRIEPKSTERFHIKVSGYSDIGSFTWNVDSASGYRPQY